MIQRLFSKFVRQCFVDVVNGKPVNRYRCKDGTEFLAHSKFDSLFFYVKIDTNE